MSAGTPGLFPAFVQSKEMRKGDTPMPQRKAPCETAEGNHYHPYPRASTLPAG